MAPVPHRSPPRRSTRNNAGKGGVVGARVLKLVKEDQKTQKTKTTKLSDYATSYIRIIKRLSNAAWDEVKSKSVPQSQKNEACFNALTELADKHHVYYNYYELAEISIPELRIEEHLFGHTMTEFTKQIHDKRFEYEKRRPQCDPVDTAMLERLVLCHVREGHDVRRLERNQLRELELNFNNILDSLRDARGNPVTSCARLLLIAQWKVTYSVMSRPDVATPTSTDGFRKALMQEARKKGLGPKVLAEKDRVSLVDDAVSVYWFLTFGQSPGEVKKPLADVTASDLHSRDKQNEQRETEEAGTGSDEDELDRPSSKTNRSELLRLGGLIHDYLRDGLWAAHCRDVTEEWGSKLESILSHLRSLVVENKLIPEEPKTRSAEDPKPGECDKVKLLNGRLCKSCLDGMENLAILMSIETPDEKTMNELGQLCQTIEA
jgi:hypothetical protein